MKRFLALLLVCFSVFCCSSCELFESPYEGRYVFYSLTKISSPEMIWGEGNEFDGNRTDRPVVLTEDFLVVELAESKGKRNEGIFIMQGEFYLYQEGVAGYWKQANGGVLLQFDICDEEVDPWLMKCDGKTIELDEEGYLFTLKKEE